MNHDIPICFVNHSFSDRGCLHMDVKGEEMVCLNCKSENLKCIDSRIRDRKKEPYIYRRRRYKCQTCGERFSTYEVSFRDYYEMKAKSDEFDWLVKALKRIGESCEKSIRNTIGNYVN